jgi:hypothetical protein
MVFILPEGDQPRSIFAEECVVREQQIEPIDRVSPVCIKKRAIVAESDSCNEISRGKHATGFPLTTQPVVDVDAHGKYVCPTPVEIAVTPV